MKGRTIPFFGCKRETRHVQSQSKEGNTIPFCLVRSSYMYHTFAPRQIIPPVDIPIIMEQHGCKIFWKKLNTQELHDNYVQLVLTEVVMKYLLYNSVHSFFLIYTSSNGNQKLVVLFRLLLELNTYRALNN